MTIILILGIICLICGGFFFHKANQIEINKNEQQEQYENQLKIDISKLTEEKNNLINFQLQSQQKINEKYGHTEEQMSNR